MNRQRAHFFTFLLLALVFGFQAQDAYAKPEKVCSTEDGKLRVKRACKTARGESEVSLSSISTIAKGEKGDTGEQGPAGDKEVICYGHINAGGTVLSFGGNGTTNVTAAGATGVYDVTCTGSYPGITSTDDLTIVASGLASTLNVAASVDSASTTELQIIIASRNSSTTALTNNETNFMVLGTLSE